MQTEITYTIVGDEAVCTMQMAAPATHDDHALNILCVDHSGSIGDKYIPYVKQGVIRYLETCVARDAVHVMLFNHEIDQFVVADSTGLPDARAKVNALQSDGMTNFIGLFDAIRALVVQKQATTKNITAYVTVFTDGKHWVQRPWTYAGHTFIDAQEERDAVARAAQLLQNVLATCMTSTFNVLAFHDGVDAGTCARMTHYGKQPGKFEYVERHSNQIMEVFTSICDTLQLVTVCTLRDEHESHAIKLHVVDHQSNRKEKIVSSRFIMPLATITRWDSSPPQLTNGGNTYSTKLVEQKEPLVVVDGQLFVLGIRIKQLTERVAECKDLTEVKKIADTITEYRTLVAESHNREFSRFVATDRLTRRKYVARYNELYQTLNNMANLLGHAIRYGHLREDDKLQILASGHAVHSASLNTRVNKLLLNNMESITQQDATIAKELSKLTDEQRKQVIDALERCDIQCMFSLSNCAEAMFDGDCMCMAMQISRPPSAIGDVNRAKITKIYGNTRLLLSVFTDALLGSIENMGSERVAQELTGGFDVRSKAGLLKGVARDKFNFVYPLFITQPYWDAVTSHLMHRVCAYASTTEFSAQTSNQLKHFPFIVVTRAVLDVMQEPTEHTVQNFMSVARVARACVSTWKMTHVDEHLSRWRSGYAQRVPAETPSLFTMLSKLLFSRDPLELLTKHDLVTIVEEHLRRNIAADAFTLKFIAAQSDALQYVTHDDSKDASSDEYIRYIDAGYVGEARPERVARVFTQDAAVTWNDAIEHHITTVLKTLKSSLKTLMTQAAFYNFFRNIDRDALYHAFDQNMGVVTDDIMQYFAPIKQAREAVYDDFTVHNCCTALDLTPAEFYAMLVQNGLDTDNQVRAQQNIQHVYNRDAAVLITRLTKKFIFEETNRQQNMSMLAFNERVARMAVEHDDVRVFAGVLYRHVQNVGSPLFRVLLDRLEELKHIPDRLEKIKMLVGGMYNDIDLYRTDHRSESKKPIRYRYPANKYHRRRLKYAFDHQQNSLDLPLIDDAAWQQIFRWYTDRIVA